MRSPQPSARSSPTNSCDGRRRGSWGWRGRLHRCDPWGTARCARGVHRSRAGAACRLSPLTATVPSAYRLVTESKRIVAAPHDSSAEGAAAADVEHVWEMASPWSENDVMRDMTCLSLNRLNSVRYKSSRQNPTHHTVRLCKRSCPSTCSSRGPWRPPARSPRVPARRGRAGVRAGIWLVLGVECG